MQNEEYGVWKLNTVDWNEYKIENFVGWMILVVVSF